jgi:hypothetical protein
MKTTAVHQSTTPAQDAKHTAEGSTTARRNFLVAALNMSWQLAIVVIVPIAAGAQLDKHLQAGNLWVFGGLALAAMLSTAIVWRTVQLANRLPVPKLSAAQKRAIAKSYEEDDKDE